MLYFDSSSTYLYLTFLGYDYTKNYTAIITTIDITSKQQGYHIQQRTASFNPMNGTNTTFLIFCSYFLTRYTNNFTTSFKISANSSQIFFDTFFITNSISDYFLLSKTSTSYLLQYFTNNSLINTVTTNITYNSSYVKTVQNNGNIFIMFDTGIYIYS
jgi:hypothetical protein